MAYLIEQKVLRLIGPIFQGNLSDVGLYHKTALEEPMFQWLHSATLNVASFYHGQPLYRSEPSIGSPLCDVNEPALIPLVEHKPQRGPTQMITLLGSRTP